MFGHLAKRHPAVGSCQDLWRSVALVSVGLVASCSHPRLTELPRNEVPYYSLGYPDESEPPPPPSPPPAPDPSPEPEPPPEPGPAEEPAGEELRLTAEALVREQRSRLSDLHHGLDALPERMRKSSEFASLASLAGWARRELPGLEAELARGNVRRALGEARALSSQLSTMSSALAELSRLARAGETTDGAFPGTGPPGSHGKTDSPDAAAQPPVLSETDLVLERLSRANIAFNAPHRLRLGEQAVIHLRLSPSATPEAVREQLAAEVANPTVEIVTAEVAMANRMEARLTGTGFQIEATSPAEQAVSFREPTAWQWQVVPAQKGPQALHLTLSVLLEVEGSATPRTVRTFQQTIMVVVTPGQYVAGFVKGNWQWMWTVCLAPVAVALWHRMRRKPARARVPGTATRRL